MQRTQRMIRLGGIRLMALLMLSNATATLASDEDGTLELQVGTYAHYSDSEDYKGPRMAMNLQKVTPSGGLYGLALFNNSFGQFSQYAFIGKRFELPQIYKYLHVNISGGIVHGYKDQYEDKVPYNTNGWGVAIFPSIGLKKERYSVELLAFGKAGLMLSFGYDLIP